MKKIDGTNVAEIAIGVFIAGVLLVALNGLLGGWIAKHGVELHGHDSTGKEIK